VRRCSTQLSGKRRAQLIRLATRAVALRRLLPREAVRRFGLGEEDTARLVGYVAEQQQLWDSDLHAAGPQCNLRSHWPRFLPWHRHIQAALDDYARQDAADNAQRISAGQKPLPSRAAKFRFTLFPVAALRPNYIPITATILKRVRGGLPCPLPCPRALPGAPAPCCAPSLARDALEAPAAFPCLHAGRGAAVQAAGQVGQAAAADAAPGRAAAAARGAGGRARAGGAGAQADAQQHAGRCG
jgi:hypothetical protein